MDANKLAILIQQLGGYDEAEQILKVDQDILQLAVLGAAIPDYQDALIEDGYNALRKDQNLAAEFGVDINEINENAERLSWVRRYIDDNANANEYRESIASGVTSIDDLIKGGGLFADLTFFQMQRVIEATQNDAEKTSQMYQAYYTDNAKGTFNQIKESAFWAWFREVFYSD